MGSELKSLAAPNTTANSKDLLPLLPTEPPTPTARSIPAVHPEPIDGLESRCAAFVRRDAYGIMGRGALPFPEKARLALALLTLLPLRFFAGILIVLLFYLICRCCTLFSGAGPNVDEQEDQRQQQERFHVDGWRRVVIVRTGRVLCRVMLFVMGFYWIPVTRHEPLTILRKKSRFQPFLATSCLSSFILGFYCLTYFHALAFNIQVHALNCWQNLCTTKSEECERPGVVVSNHVSYVDILYHMSSSFPSFVAKRSVARLPLVGIISKCLGCIYVQRESKSSDSKGVAGIIMDRIQIAHQDNLLQLMMIFPEGTTTNGGFLLPFKSGAFLAKTPVLPVIMKYRYKRFSPAWDSISGVRHMVLLLCQFQNYLEVVHLPVYYPSQQEKDDPKLYADNVRKVMAMKGNLTLTEAGLGEKRVYHAALNGNGLPRDLHQKDD